MPPRRGASLASGQAARVTVSASAAAAALRRIRQACVTDGRERFPEHVLHPPGVQALGLDVRPYLLPGRVGTALQALALEPVRRRLETHGRRQQRDVVDDLERMRPLLVADLAMAGVGDGGEVVG